MPTHLLNYFQIYPQHRAPFMHAQFIEWQNSRPLRGLTVLHHVPLVTNTLLKIACLVAAGAEMIVTNPSFMSAQSAAITALQADGITYVADIIQLRGKIFDLYFDCGAELYQILGRPRQGAIELTASGDQIYRKQLLDFPVISIDPTLTKQLETVLGSAESASTAIAQLTELDVAKKSWLIFGFGKIGRGLAYYCVKNHVPVVVVDTTPAARAAAQALGIRAIDPKDIVALQSAVAAADIVVTATGRKAALAVFPKQWFKGKILANMGVFDEYGSEFHDSEVLNNKLPVNFILAEPTPIRYIDPEFYAHNIAALELLNSNSALGMSNLSAQTDQNIIERWCQYHRVKADDLLRWFIC